MASSDRCSTCKKTLGVCLCAGCKVYFCGKDFIEHRQQLRNELDELSQSTNELQDKIHGTVQLNESDNTLLSRIDEWQQTTIDKVKAAAEEARKEVNRLMSTQRIELTNRFESLLREFEELRVTEGFLEQDLIRLKDIIHQSTKDLEDFTQFSTVELRTTQCDQIAWNQLINVENKKPAYNEDRQKQQRMTDVTLSTSSIDQIPAISRETIKFADQQNQKSIHSTASPSNMIPQDATKPSIFSNFTSSSGWSIFQTSTPTKKPSSSSSGNSSSSNIAIGGFNFADASKTTASANTSLTFSFEPTNKPLLGNAPKLRFVNLVKQSSTTDVGKHSNTVSPRQRLVTFGAHTSITENDRDSGEDDSYEPDIPFKQIVQLSPVEVQTGEEDESILFCERGKLYRFDCELNQMKERGTGEMKILQHKTTRTCRILMRREHVLNLCANHRITSQMELIPHLGAKTAYVWSAMDFADGEAKHETLCIRFKSSDAGTRFVKQFHDAKQVNAHTQK